MSTTQPTTDNRLTIAVILGSTRDGRAGKPITDWFHQQAQARTDIDIELIDLARDQLPVVLPDYDVETLPEPVTKVGARLAAADGFVVITPEYNHAYPAALKNAIDWYYHEWNAKPVAFVSYGGMAQGIRAIEQLRQVFVELHAMTTRDGVSINLDETDAHGHPTSPGIEGAVKLMLDQLVWWARALHEAREARPYVA